jgi:hypothetical protein
LAPEKDQLPNAIFLSFIPFSKFSYEINRFGLYNPEIIGDNTFNFPKTAFFVSFLRVLLVPFF